MYTNINFPSKKALKEAVTSGQLVTTFQPGPFPGTTNGVAFLEGPHYPQPHKWYAKVILQDGAVVKVF